MIPAARDRKGRFDTRSWFQPCLEEAKITSYVWHSNRHTFCLLARNGWSVNKKIQELAGHKTITDVCTLQSSISRDATFRNQ